MYTRVLRLWFGFSFASAFLFALSVFPVNGDAAGQCRSVDNVCTQATNSEICGAISGCSWQPNVSTEAVWAQQGEPLTMNYPFGTGCHYEYECTNQSGYATAPSGSCSTPGQTVDCYFTDSASGCGRWGVQGFFRIRDSFKCEPIPAIPSGTCVPAVTCSSYTTQESCNPWAICEWLEDLQVSISASPSRVSWWTGGTVTVSWSTNVPASCTASGDWSGSKASSGSESVRIWPFSSAKTYSLSCTTQYQGSDTDSATVLVGNDDICANIPGEQTALPAGRIQSGNNCVCPEGTIDDPSGQCVTPSPVPALTFSVDSSSVFWGGSTILRWTGQNVDSCTASGDWSGAKNVSGSESTGMLWSDKTYVLNCTGANGSVNRSVAVSVGFQPNSAPVASLSGHTSLRPGETGTWNFGATDSNGNLARWRFYSSTNPNPQWTTISGSSVTGSYSTSFSSTGTYTWIVEVEDADGARHSVSLSVVVSSSTNPTYQCSDGIDNDADTKIDFPADPGCVNANDDSEDNAGPCTVNCPGGGPSGGVGPIVQPPRPVPGFTVSGGQRIAIQFLAGLGATSEPTSLSVNPVNNFESPVTLSVQSIRSASSGAELPSGVVPTYYFGGAQASSIVMTYNPSLRQYVGPNGLIGTTFAVRLSKKIDEKYLITIVGTSGSLQPTFQIELDPNNFIPDFKEI